MKTNLHLVSIFSVASFYLLIGNAFAGNNSYTCEVKHVYKLTEQGMLETDLSLEPLFIANGKFFISKKSGRITGNQALKTPSTFSAEIINSGSSEHSFKAIASCCSALESIQVNEFVDGIEKPFIKMDLISITTGLCK